MGGWQPAVQTVLAAWPTLRFEVRCAAALPSPALPMPVPVPAACRASSLW